MINCEHDYLTDISVYFKTGGILKMKKLLKITSLVLAIAISAFCFAGCGNNKTDEKTETKTSNEETTNDTSDTLKMATNAAFPPYESKEGDKFVGIDVEIAQAIADDLGKKLEICDMEFDSIITSVDKGEADFAMAGLTVTDERKKEVDFTSSYATGVQVVIVKADSAYTTPDDLKGKKIGVQLGTTGDAYAADDYGDENVIRYSKGADAVIALKGGDVDAVIIDNEPAKAFVAENEGLKILDTEYVIEDYAIAVKKGNNELLDSINKSREKLTSNGKIDEIIAKYIKAE